MSKIFKVASVFLKLSTSGSGLIIPIIAFCTTSAFVGLAGFGKAMLVGAGTGLGASIVALPAALAVGGVLALIGAAAARKKGAAVAGMAGMVLGGLGGMVFGGVKGYEFSKDALTAKSCETSFNMVAPASAPTYDIKSNTLTIKASAPRLG